MRLSISNIAWDVEEDKVIATLLQRYQVDAIDIAPGKYFPDPVNATDSDISRVKNWWASYGIEIVGMQALLFGTQGLNVFGSLASQQSMLSHLNAVCNIAAKLGSTRLVFGSPRNRDCEGLDKQNAINVAVPFFRKLGNIAEKHGVIFCLEPNPIQYGANFMTTTAETAYVVEQVQHPSIRMQLDTGAITINNESIDNILSKHSHLIGHIHISEADLLPIGMSVTQHDAIHHSLKKYLPDHVVTIEMVATKNEPHLLSVERAIQNTINSYRPKFGNHLS